MKKEEDIKFLNRFTQCKFAYDMIETMTLKVPTPDTWPDKNDSKPLLEYCKTKGHNKIFALCFTHDTETVYHWYIGHDFQNTCCIQFNYKLLKKHFEKEKFKCDIVKYKKLRARNKSESYKTVNFEDIPFSKRWPYRIESEYRVIHSGEYDKDYNLFEVPISPKCIQRITTADNWWKKRFSELSKKLKKRVGHEIEVNPTTLEENEIWLKHMNSLNN